MIEIQNASFRYDALAKPVLDNLSLTIRKGETIAVLGRNGSGKSTFARLLNGLLLPTSGKVLVNGFETNEPSHQHSIRETVQMVFQNPEHQILGMTVEEDIAFGLSNIGCSETQMRERIQEVLRLVGLEHKYKTSVHTLSGGEKQKLAIASALAFLPGCLVLDEATSMLDSGARKRFIQDLLSLHTQTSMTLVHVTHHTDEILYFNRVIVLHDARLQYVGTPFELFQQYEILKRCGIEIPYHVRLSQALQKRGLQAPMTREGLIQWIRR